MSDWHPASVVITGGASGIGLAIARKLAEGGAKVMLTDLPGEQLDSAAAEIGSEAQPCDVSDPAQVEALADAAFERLGHVDLLLNNAGVSGPRGPLWEVDLDQARAMFEINFWGVFHGCRAFAPRLIAQDRPSAIYNTGSENSLFCAAPQIGSYIAGKHAVLGLTESLREDLPDHVHAGTIVPGWVFTPFGPDMVMKHAMPVADYVDIVVPQILARRRFVVSHGYNQVRIAERMDELEASFDEYAIPADEDPYDVRNVMAKMMGG